MQKKILFIDRDGTIISEPPTDFQVDSLEKLEFIPYAISALQQIYQQGEYHLVMVTNQDGLGTDSFPEHTFWPAHDKMLTILKNEGIEFYEIHIDRSFEYENKPTRKPGTAMLQKYLDGSYDIAHSVVIGDRLTDIQLAENLGAKSILIHPTLRTDSSSCVLQTASWKEISELLTYPPRKANIVRTTNETHIEIALNLDGVGKTDIRTGLGFFDHMLDQLGKHSNTDMVIQVHGDLHIDEHHTIEDTGLALGEAFLKALGNKKHIERYGFLLPMDDCLAQAAIDFSGRPWLVWEATFHREKVGDMPTEMFFHFWKSFADAAKCNLNIKAEGENEHHKIEAIFKAVAKSIKMAKSRNILNKGIPSTKGTL